MTLRVSLSEVDGGRWLCGRNTERTPAAKCAGARRAVGDCVRRSPHRVSCVRRVWGAHAVVRVGRRSGVVVDPRFKGFSLFFMAMILIWPIMIGLNFLLVPGLLLAAKWVMAPAFLVSEERDLFQASGDSWRASSGNTLALTLAPAD